MDLAKLLETKNITQYRLSKLSNVPQATISDICSNKTTIEKCSAITLFKIANALNITVEDIFTKEIDNIPIKEFEIFKSNMCHKYKSMDAKDFVNEIIESNIIHKLYASKEYTKCFYLTALLDYISDKYQIKQSDDFNQIRSKSLLYPIYPESILTLDKVLKTNKNKKEAYKSSLPQFREFNIVENEIENVY